MGTSSSLAVRIDSRASSPAIPVALRTICANAVQRVKNPTSVQEVSKLKPLELKVHVTIAFGL